MFLNGRSVTQSRKVEVVLTRHRIHAVQESGAAGAGAASSHMREGSGMADMRKTTLAQYKLADAAARSPSAVAQRALNSLAGRSEQHALQRMQSVIQAKTEIEHTPGYIKFDAGSGTQNFMVGTSMTAKLDVGYPVVGSATGANWTWMQALRSKYPAANIVRGHLLNHDLGGYAVPENLYPISTLANANHSSEVEQHVKGLLNDDNAKKDRVYYKVDVVENSANDPAKAAFDCTFGWENGKRVNKKIDSDLGKDKGGFGGGGKKVQAHKNWHHGKRKGEQDVQNALLGGSVKHNAMDPNINITKNVDAKYGNSSEEGKKLAYEEVSRELYQYFIKTGKEQNWDFETEMVWFKENAQAILDEAWDTDEVIDNKGASYTLYCEAVNIFNAMKGLD